MEEGSPGRGRLEVLLGRIQEHAAAYFPDMGASSRVEIREHRRRAYSDVYWLSLGAGRSRPQEVIVKISADAEVQYRAMREAWPRFAQHGTLKIPRPLDYFPDESAVVMEAVNGRTLHERLPWFVPARSWGIGAEGECEQAGKWLRFYHGGGPHPSEAIEVEKKVHEFGIAGRALVEAGMSQNDVESWRDRLRSDGEKLRGQLLAVSRVHGDFTIDNVLFGDSKVTGLDALGVDRNVIYNDIASFLNSLLLLRLTRPVSRVAVARFGAAFMRGYFGNEPWDDLAVRYLQRTGLVDVMLEILGRRRFPFSRLILERFMRRTMRELATRSGESV